MLLTDRLYELTERDEIVELMQKVREKSNRVFQTKDSVLPGKSFNSISSSLEYALDQCTDKQHAFLINIATAADEFTNFACTVQVVDENRIFENGKFGLAIYLAFDLTMEKGDELERLKQMPEFDEFTDVSYESEIECFALGFGGDVAATLKMISRILVSVYECSVDDSFVSTVYDEGPTSQQD